MTENFDKEQRFSFFFVISTIFHVVLLFLFIAFNPAPTKAKLQKTSARVGVKYMTKQTATIPSKPAAVVSPAKKMSVPAPPKIKKSSAPKTVKPIKPPPKPTKQIDAPKAKVNTAPPAKPVFNPKKQPVLSKPTKPQPKAVVKKPTPVKPQLPVRKLPASTLPKLELKPEPPSLDKKLPAIANPTLPQTFPAPEAPKFSIQPDYVAPKITIQESSPTPEDLKQPLVTPELSTPSTPIIDAEPSAPEAPGSTSLPAAQASPGRSTLPGNTSLPGMTLQHTRHVRDQYNALIAAAIKQNLYAPERFDTELVVQIEVAIGLQGELVRYKLQKSSGIAAFDLAALNAVKTTNFHELPEELAKSPPYIVVFEISP